MTRPTPAAPDRTIDRLRHLARNVWWSWNDVAQRPFAMIDPVQWEASNHDPLATMTRTHPARLRGAFDDPAFIDALDAAERAVTAAMTRESWYEAHADTADADLRVAYFCSEFAIHESMPQYSGGLGVLAGDHVKSASDLGIPLVGVGLLYRHGYYLQQIETDGATRVLYPDQTFERMPLEDTGVQITCPIGARGVRARVWRMMVGRSPIYLLDADLAANHDADRLLTEGLYKGEPDLRLRQQVLLGVGGTLALHAVGEAITVDHLNEGHAAFAAVQRVREQMQHGASFEDAIAAVRARTVFTTHTPVPAGHDRYAMDDVAALLAPVAHAAGFSEDDLMALGADSADPADQFCMTTLALRLARHVNGVAQLHGEVSRAMWGHIYDANGEPLRTARPTSKRRAPKPAAVAGDETESVVVISSAESATAASAPIGAITNGVHPGSWIDPAAAAFWTETIGLDLDAAEPHVAAWARAEDVDRAALWQLRCALRARLVHAVRTRVRRQTERRGSTPTAELHATSILDRDALTICFARRFATYKRAPLIFSDPDRLAALLNDPARPVQLIFAGKAHPRDDGGQAFLQDVVQWSRDPRFATRVAVLEEYDMGVGRLLTSGADVWLNTPRRPHEASGTSGMKVPLHGGLNCSILDGWWPEAFDGGNGWAIGDTSEELDEAAGDTRDAAALYEVLEQEVVPMFYDRDAAGLPGRWLDFAAHAAATVAPHFSTHRMLEAYLDDAYRPAHRGG